MSQPCVENYLRMIAKKAWTVWHKLPPQHKGWIGVEDLIQDGVLFTRFKVIPRFRPHRAKFGTFLEFSLDNFYKNLLAEYFTHKRNDCQLQPVCSVQFRLTRKDQMENEVLAVQGLVKVITEASPVLRHYLNRWLFDREKTRCHTRGEKFAIARSELLELSRRCGFGRDDFEYLLRNEGWRRSLQSVQKKFLE